MIKWLQEHWKKKSKNWPEKTIVGQEVDAVISNLFLLPSVSRHLLVTVQDSEPSCPVWCVICRRGHQTLPCWLWGRIWIWSTLSFAQSGWRHWGPTSWLCVGHHLEPEPPATRTSPGNTCSESAPHFILIVLLLAQICWSQAELKMLAGKTRLIENAQAEIDQGLQRPFEGSRVWVLNLNTATKYVR